MDKIVPQREGTITDYTGKEEAICGKQKNPYGLPASGQPNIPFLFSQAWSCKASFLLFQANNSVYKTNRAS